MSKGWIMMNILPIPRTALIVFPFPPMQSITLQAGLVGGILEEISSFHLTLGVGGKGVQQGYDIKSTLQR